MKRSSVYKLFHLVEGTTKAKCALCAKDIEQSESGATSGLWTHLTKVHFIEKNCLDNNLTWTCVSDSMETNLS